MNKPATIRFLSVGLLVLLPTFPAAAHAAASTESQLLALEQTWMQAAQERNVPVLSRILADDYIDINYEGVVRDKRDALNAPNLKMKHYAQQLSDEKVRLYGETAIVTGRGVLSKNDGVEIAAWRFTDVFVRGGGVWRAVSSQETIEHSR